METQHRPSHLQQQHSRSRSVIPREIATTSWTFPFRGIYYFATHRFLWPLFISRLIPCTVLSLFVLSILFTFTYLPQVTFLAIFHGWASAWINGAFLVLGEGAAIIALLFEAWFVDETQVDIFDSVLVNEGYTSLVAPSRPVDALHTDPYKKLGKPYTNAIYAPFSFRQTIEFILLLPLLLVPWIGLPAFLILTGARGGPFHHWRYFQLLGLDKKGRKREIRRRRWKYTWFGTSALILQLVPGLSMLFLLTTAAGAALWAIRLEKRRAVLRGEVERMGVPQTEGRHATVMDAAEEDDAPPPYSDVV